MVRSSCVSNVQMYHKRTKHALQERITEVLPSVHGVFLSRMLRHMLETPGMICDRDYERLAFVYGILLSDKCQVCF